MHHVTLLPRAADTVYSQRAARLKKKRGIKEEKREEGYSPLRAIRGWATRVKRWRRRPKLNSATRMLRASHQDHHLQSPRLHGPSRGCPLQTRAVVWRPQWRRWWDVDRCTLSCCHTDTQSASLYLHWAPSRSLHSLAGGEKDTNMKWKPILNQSLQKMISLSLPLSVQTLIRNLRDSSTRVTLVRPALWQMDTVLVDQAVEKFNLRQQQVTTAWRQLEVEVLHFLEINKYLKWCAQAHIVH